MSGPIRCRRGSSAGAAGIPAFPQAAFAAEPTEHPKPITDKWDVSWADRVEAAKYRAQGWRAVAFHYGDGYSLDVRR